MQVDSTDPAGGAERLSHFSEPGLGDAAAEEAFDRAARLAARLLEVPVAQVSLIDAGRQVYRSSAGTARGSGPPSVPLDLSFCRHVVASGEALMIEDARSHPLACEDHEAAEPGVVAYVAVPLTTREGLTCGTLSAVDFRPRTWTEEHVDVLTDLARTLTTEIGLRRDLRMSERKRAETVPPAADEERQAQADGRTSELTRLEAAERRVRTILESITDGFFAVDRGWRFTYVNEQAEELFGRSRHDLLGSDLWELFPASRGRQFYPQYHRAVDDRTAVEFEEYSPPADRWMHVRAYPSENGLSVYLRDITTRKKAEAALQRAKEEAEEASRSKNEFLSRMSHELRTPLNAILGFGQLLELDLTREEDRESVEQILKAGKHLLTLIDEVLDIARIEAGRLALSSEPVQVGELIAEVLSFMRPLARERRVQLPGEGPAACQRYVRADQQRLKQVLLNLCSNAIKYNRDGGQVALECEERTAGWLRIVVSDTGRGIAPEELGRLFSPFDRLGAEQTGVQGTGLGLALSKSLIEAMGGTIGAESAPEQGSRFWIELPLAESQLEQYEREQLAAEVTHREVRRNRGTVLYIEDNLSNLRLVERILARYPGIQIIPAMQGRLGLELAREHRPDLVLLDLNLPDVSGDEVLRELRADDITHHIPVVIVSADATPRQMERLRDQGARDYLTKPFDVQRFLEILEVTMP